MRDCWSARRNCPREKGGGSLTALPIAETDAGNLSAYIPTNLISITDGQIVLDARLFHEGQKPAVDVGVSVSRVGGKTQAQALRDAAASLRLDYAQFLELEMFTRFGGMPDSRVRGQLARGARIRAILNQPQHAPLRLADEVALITAVQNGLLDALPPDAIADFRARPGRRARSRRRRGGRAHCKRMARSSAASAQAFTAALTRYAQNFDLSRRSAMTERLADVRARIDGVRQLGSVVNAMRGIAAARAQTARNQLAAVDAYAQTVAGAVAQALRLARQLPRGCAAVAAAARAGARFAPNRDLPAPSASARWTPSGADLAKCELFLIGSRGVDLAAQRNIQRRLDRAHAVALARRARSWRTG